MKKTNRKPARKPASKLKELLRSPTVFSSIPEAAGPSSVEVYGGKPYLPTDYGERKEIPICTGVLDYFPLALLEVAKVSAAGNAQHNPGEPLHWARGKSMNQMDTMLRHIMERGNPDTDKVLHMAKAVWRGLAELQIECEQRYGLPISRGSREPAKS